MKPAAVYLVLIYLQPGQIEALRRYENRALPVFERHGGRFERIMRPAPAPDGSAADPDIPDEVHLLRFDTPDGLDAVRRDPRWSRSCPCAVRSCGRPCWSGSRTCRWSGTSPGPEAGRYWMVARRVSAVSSEVCWER